MINYKQKASQSSKWWFAAFGIYLSSFPVAQMVENLPARQETRVQSLGWEVPLEKGMAIRSSILAWRIHGQRSLAGYSLWGLKESDTTEWLTQYLPRLIAHPLCPVAWGALFLFPKHIKYVIHSSLPCLCYLYFVFRPHSFSYSPESYSLVKIQYSISSFMSFWSLYLIILLSMNPWLCWVRLPTSTDVHFSLFIKHVRVLETLRPEGLGCWKKKRKANSSR